MDGYCSERVGGNIYIYGASPESAPVRKKSRCLQLTKLPIASFASSILSSDHSTLVTTGRVATYQDPRRIPAGFPTGGRVFHDVELLTDRTLISSKKKGNNSDKEKDKDLSDAFSAPDLPSPPVPVLPSVVVSTPGFKALSPLSLDPEDTVILRARVIRFRYLTGKGSTDADNVFATLRRLVERISNPCASEKEVGNVEGTRNALYIGAHVRVKL